MTMRFWCIIALELGVQHHVSLALFLAVYVLNLFLLLIRWPISESEPLFTLVWCVRQSPASLWREGWRRSSRETTSSAEYATLLMVCLLAYSLSLSLSLSLLLNLVVFFLPAVNPGGWAPPSIVRTIGKRELCKFLVKFGSTVQSRLQSTPLTL